MNYLPVIFVYKWWTF